MAHESFASFWWIIFALYFDYREECLIKRIQELERWVERSRRERERSKRTRFLHGRRRLDSRLLQRSSIHCPLQELSKEFVENAPRHWNCPCHTKAEPLLLENGVTPEVFDIIRHFRKRYAPADGSVYITVSNFESRFLKDTAMLDAWPDVPQTDKDALKIGMGLVHKQLMNARTKQLELNGTSPSPGNQTGPLPGEKISPGRGIGNGTVQGSIGKRPFSGCARIGGRVGVAAVVVGTEKIGPGRGIGNGTVQGIIGKRPFSGCARIGGRLGVAAVVAGTVARATGLYWRVSR